MALLLLLATALPAAAQVMLKADLTPLTLRLKSDTPAPALVDMQYSGISLLEGTLDIRLRDEAGSHLFTLSIPDIAVTAGTQTFRITLPALRSYSSGFVQADLVFRTRNAAYLVGNRQLMVSGPMERVLSVGVVRGDELPDDKLFDTIRGLRLDRFEPEKEAGDNRPSARLISTYQAFLPAEEMPVTPLGCCSFDLICVTGRGFSLLRERQLDAILGWVKAGGSVAVFPGADVKPYHLEFLNKLAGKEQFYLNARGAVINKVSPQSAGHSERSEESSQEPASSPVQTLRGVYTERSERAQGDKQAGASLPLETEGVTMRRLELGRALIALSPAPDAEWPGWRRAAAFLWKARKAQMDSLIAKDAWDPKQNNFNYEREAYPLYQQRVTPTRGGLAPGPGAENRLVTAAPLTLSALNGLTAMLAPRQVRVIPFWLVGFLLVVFLGLIGPGDYFILGWLGKRKYTWVTLPVYCVAFTALFVGLSRYYIGGKDHRRALIIQDEDADGNVLRASRIEMVFTAGSRRVLTPVTNSLAVAVPVQGQYYYDGSRGVTQPPDYVGRYPASYQLEQQMEQWTYRVYRFLSLEQAHAGRKIDWKGINPSAPDFARALAGSGNVSVERMHAAEETPLNQMNFGGYLFNIHLLREFSVHPQANLFSIVSQISPSGTPVLEDLALLDPTDPNQWLLLAVEQQGDDIIVHRHLYCIEDK